MKNLLSVQAGLITIVIISPGRTEAKFIISPEHINVIINP